MRKVIEALDEGAKNAVPVDKWEGDLTYDGKTFFYKGSKISSVTLAEEVLHYVEFKGILTRWKLTKDDLNNLFDTIWKAIPNNYNVTAFGNRGVVVRGVKSGKDLIVQWADGKSSKFDGAWYLKSNSEDKENFIFSENEAPRDIKYTDIANDFGKKHTFKKTESSIGKGKKIEFEDDLVVVYKDGKEIYKGIEDDEPMKRENWSWSSKDGCYKFKNYTKVVM